MINNQIDIIDKIIKNIFIKITKESKIIYALVWSYDAFLFEPRKEG